MGVDRIDKYEWHAISSRSRCPYTIYRYRLFFFYFFSPVVYRESFVVWWALNVLLVEGTSATFVWLWQRACVSVSIYPLKLRSRGAVYSRQGRLGVKLQAARSTTNCSIQHWFSRSQNLDCWYIGRSIRELSQRTTLNRYCYWTKFKIGD